MRPATSPEPVRTGPPILPPVSEVAEIVLAGLTTVKALAAALGVSEKTIKRFIREGLPVIYVGAKAYPEIAGARTWFQSRRGRRRPTAGNARAA